MRRPRQTGSIVGSITMGGHVNLFRSKEQLSAAIENATGLSMAACIVLSTSFGFLRREHFLPRPPRRMWILANGAPWCIALLSYLARQTDRLFSTRLSVYGWALYFGRLAQDVAHERWFNVCGACGASFSSDSLLAHARSRWYPARSKIL